MAKVNLDALIPREDFEVEAGTESQTLGDRLKVSELVKGQGFFYSSLRKPDFQRETSDWDKDKITAFIKSFLDGDLIPSIILWQAGQYTFVIDGAHRLSALISWVNDDYGDGPISQAFFNHDIDTEQKRVSDQTRRYIDKAIGSYRSFMQAISDQTEAHPDKLAQANKLGFLSLQLQWVTGSSKKAENSFFTINQRATPISETEIALLKARKKPYAMASRAIIRSGTGHKFWKNFNDEQQVEVEKLAREMNESLFTPEIKTPIKTLDLPLAGKGYSSRSLPLIFDLVKLANQVEEKQDIQDDENGYETISYLKNTSKIIRRFTTPHASSLGLHPAVYFYSEKGRYQPTAFMAWIEVIKKFQSENLFSKFTKNRENFEKYLISHKFLVNQVTIKYGSGLKGYKHLTNMILSIFDAVSEGKSSVGISSVLTSNYHYLNINYKGDEPSGIDFNTNTKSEIFITAALSSAQKCSICSGYIHVNSISIDHIERKQDGGSGKAKNGQLTHPYCNSTYKN